ncbi:MAG: RnfABCDGE type electron transport complex subunit D [Acidimicrobiales bacterium]
MTTTPIAPPLAPAEAPPKPRPEVTIGGRRIPVILPKRSDPRLKLSATIWTITLLGLTVLSFQVSIPQIAVTVLLCAAIEVGVTYRREHVLVWPASALQTGISVAFIFRVAGTRQADYWSTRGLWIFVAVALMSLLPKYIIRYNNRHVFNPSNIGLAWGLLLFGPSHVFSEHLWWAPLGAPVLVAFAVIVAGAFWVLRQVKMIPLATAFLATFLPIIALFALFGRDYVAAWHNGPVGGSFYWLTIALSPEVLIFTFFMITDPQTAPKSKVGRLIYASLTAVVAAVLILPQGTEFGIKVAILSSLLVTCALTPAIDRLGRRIEARRSGEEGMVAAPEAAPVPAAKPLLRRFAAAARRPVLVAVVIIAVAAPLNTALLARDKKIVLIEQGLTTRTVQ